ncbi:MAG: hypothetical protein ACE5FT_01140 [Candidatus Nanoarchaeia archaeon]
MAKLRYIVPALLFLTLGLVLWINPSGSVTASLPLDNVPGGAPSVYVLLIIGGVVLGVSTLRRTDNKIEPAPMVDDPLKRTVDPLKTDSEGYVNLDSKLVETKIKPIIRPLAINGKEDVETVRQLLREGPYVLVLNISKVRNNMDELKQWLRSLDHTVRARNGGIVGLDKTHILVTSEVKIKKQK